MSANFGRALDPCGMACGRAWRRDACVGAGLARAPGEDHHPARSGRRRRRVHALAGRGIAEAARPAVPRREPAGRRAQHRLARLRRGAAGRLYALRAVRRAGGLQPVHVQEPAVQSGEGFRAGRRHVHQRQRAGHQFVAQRQDDPRAGGLRQGQARHAELRHVLVHAGLFHGQAEQGQRHRHRPRAVPQRQRDGQRGDDRHDADRVPRARQHDRPDQERPVHRARAQFQRPLAAVSRHPDARRGDGRGLSAAVVRPVRAGRHAGRRSWKRSTPRCSGITSEPGFRQKNYIDRAVEPMAGPRDEFIKFIANNRAFAARVAKETGMQPQ